MFDWFENGATQGELKMKNLEILKRIPTYRGQNWNPLIEEILDNDMRFWRYEIPTLDRGVYAMTNQLLDILNLEREQKYHKIQYELADLFSMSLGYSLIYGNPLPMFKYRFGLNHSVKGEKDIVAKYENRFLKYGAWTLERLQDILYAHESEEYFQTMQMRTMPNLDVTGI